MLQWIYISLCSVGTLSSGFRPRNFVFKIFQSPPPPLIKKTEWAVLYPKYILVSLTLNSKLAQGWGTGLGGVNRGVGVWGGYELSYFLTQLLCGYELSYFPLPTELSNSWVALSRKTGSCLVLTWKKNVFWTRAIEWITVLNIWHKRHENILCMFISWWKILIKLL